MKVTITVNDELLKKIDEYAEENFMPRSTFMALACKTYMEQAEVMKLMPDIIALVKESENLKQLKDAKL